MKRQLLLLPAVLFALAGATSCVSDDWDDYDPDYGRRYDRYDDYDEWADRRERRRRHEMRERERDRREYERERAERDRDRGRRDAPGAVNVKTPKGFVLAGSFRAGEAVECGIPTSKKIKKVRLIGTSGTVSVNTVVLREGSAKTPHPVTRRLGPGESVEIDLGGAHQATGLRISTGGKGTYNVYVH